MNLVRRILTCLRALLPRLSRLLPPLPRAEYARVISAAHIEDLDGMPALYLAGTHYEMGYQHGSLARSRIYSFRRDAYVYMAGEIQQAMKWPRWLARLLTRPLLFWQTSAYWNTIPSEYLEEVRGVADGAGVHPVEVVLVTAIWEMYLVGGCSEFVVTGARTADDTLIHGYNYDLMAPEHALINPHLAMIFYRPEGGIPFSTLNTVGSIGVNGGMSDAGLSIAWDNTYTRDRSLYEGIRLPVVPFIVTLRRVLETCHSVDEGIQLVVDTLPRPLADVVIIASAEEDRAVALETAGHVYALRPLEDDAVWNTNCFRSVELGPHERRGDWREMGADESARIFPRYTSYDLLLERHRSGITPRLALDLLRDPYPREAEGALYHSIAHRSTICREATGFSLVMQPGLGLIWGSDGKLPAPHGHFFAFDQRSWKRRPELDFAPSGLRPAMACAEAYLRGDLDTACARLQEALAAEGETPPLLLMRSVLLRARGDGNRLQAQADVDRVAERWGKTAIGAVARAWGANEEADLPPIPFPSAIAARLSFHAAADAQKRVQEPPHAWAQQTEGSSAPGGQASNAG
jgi:predicted choloylglycine hydrolase